ncbi:glutamine--fructose-6-phosphate transaminase (isomerizing) [Olsenella sp. YH-ols2217]|uniref:Glutamine--fructose-6-phosphate aminotransferase [isomerizing] n=1 Tax=Kribbibacterium absianum TaxID=3044210 RepID=A0ABT6ZK98_9ACTN|nr:MULTISPECIES: glutamine--fructose-6-phosphate transaminase (isomerizing) [unclassified Olsenella]MDJ1122565.1 glutamine--fructose-6-phosphate transaminase (isomerizing) [Olsenella sp. YH-ols2216]MDJ1129475.1 glutamine--fructose-6-phosphate transaminase (isomerizing) [Olsenella sp. YH-ols2217]
MCGIVGYTGSKPALPFLIDGLTTLEYRGYDSAGVELETPDGLLQVKCKGRVAALADLCSRLSRKNAEAPCGIAHTRWATHGEPSDKNAHPHQDCTGNVAVVHNGIIENYQALVAELEAAGHTMASDTDSEVIAHLIEQALAGDAEGDLLLAVQLATSRLVGSWALAVLYADAPGTIVCARQGSPLVLASTDAGAYAASDVTALAGVTNHVINLDDGQLARLSLDGTIEVFESDLSPVDQPDAFDIDWDASAATMGGYPDFMAKEIAEQPEAIERLLKDRLGPDGVRLDELAMTDEEIAAIDRIFIVACGTSYHVGLIARPLIEEWARIPVAVEPASEFNYEDVLVTDHTLCIIITQSGETADTLASARKMHAAGAKVLAVTNVIGSSAAREADGVLYVQAGPEVSVASTKAYTAQMVAAELIALFLAQRNGNLGAREVARRFHELQRVPAMIREVLHRSWQDEAAARAFVESSSALFLGRGLNATTAAEGALKLKEISYLHAEAYPAGEMKHGPIALIDPGFPVVVICPDDRVRYKTLSNIQEVKARGATVVTVATDGDQKTAQLSDYLLLVPAAPEYLVPIVAVVHLQMLARYVALARGCDIDKPRNLAKSVTVE